jgi:peptidyl-prolyl cis-trans isomerase SurA
MLSLFVRPLAATAPVVLASLIVLSTLGIPKAQAASSSKDAGTMRAAAVVNDIVISSYDLDQRVKLMMVTSGAQGQDTAKRLRPQVLRQLVDELLQLQEAQKSKVQITTEDLDKSLKRIAQQNNISVDQIYKTLDDAKISRSTLQTQIKADLAWQKLIQQRLAPRVTVSDEEVAAAYAQAQESSKQPQYLVSEIFLAVDVPSAEEQVKQNVANILTQLKAGANFSALARQFSQSATASSGGDMGWMTLADLPEPVAQKVKVMANGALSEAIRAPGGYYLIGLRQKRLAAGATPQAAAPPPVAQAQPEQKMKAVITLGRMSVPMAPGVSKAKEEQVRNTAIELFRSVNGCSTAGAAARSRGAKFDMIGPVTVKDLAPQFVDILKKTPNGRSTPPLRGAKGIEMYVICDGGMKPAASIGGASEGGDKPAAEVTKEEIENRLFNQELTMLARRYLRDLRRDATIEMKDN